MTASGPFAMGPTLAGGSNIRRSTPHSKFPLTPSISRTSTTSGENLSYSVPPPLKKDVGNADDSVNNGTAKTEDEEYSDPDEGVEIVDMENVHRMDWMAPDSIKKERKNSQKKVKKEENSAF